MLNVLLKSDLIGATASALCVVHCVATPFLFLVQTCPVSGCCDTSPVWWSSIDYVFIGVTALAVYQSGLKTSRTWVKQALFMNWLVLSLLIFNEKLGFLAISEIWKYLAAAGLIGLHVYNLKFCRCSDESCCVPQ